MQPSRAATKSRRPDIAIFSAPKAFIGHTGVIQRNAVRSWLALGDRAEVVLLGHDAGVAEIATEFGILHVPDIETNEYGTPLLNSMMQVAEANTTAPYLVMINGDIILTSDFFRFVDKLPSLPQGLYIGLRSDLDVLDPLDFGDPDWEAKLEHRVRTRGRYRGDGDDSFNGTDYYIYPRGLYDDVPPFGIGRFFWDSWLIADVWRRGRPVVDASAEILAVHQNHDYGHVRSGGTVDFYRYWENPELKRNHHLARGFLNGMGPREAPFRYRDGNIARVSGRAMWKSQLYNFWYYYPIMLRGSWLFRRTPVGRAFPHLFPFDAPTGRHRFSLRGAGRVVAYKALRPAWKLLPSPVRALGHRALGAGRRLASLVRLPARRAATVPQPITLYADGENMTGVFADVHRAFNALASPGERVLAPQWACPAIDGLFSYGYFTARKTWANGDLDFAHVILSRRDLRRLPPAALRATFAAYTEVFRDENFALLTRAQTTYRDLRTPTWPELAERLDVLDPRSDSVLAVLNVWKRGPDLLRRQIQGLLEQTLPVSEIWVCAFGLDNAAPYEAVLGEFTGVPIHLFKSSKNLKYHGRFQLALQAETDFVAFIDDDILIGADFLRICRDTLANTPDAGEVGLYGWLDLPGPGANGAIGRYTTGTFIEHLPPERKVLGRVEVDMLCGFHFLRAADIRYLFYDEPWTVSTGEDFQLAFALRKYAGLKSYVVPVDPKDSATWGLSDDWLDIRVHATTVGDADAVRDALYWKLLNRGHAPRWMYESAARGDRYVFAVFATASQAKAARIAAAALGEPETRIVGLYCGEVAGVEAAAAAFDVSPEALPAHSFEYLSLELRATAPERAVDAIEAVASMARALKPACLMAPRDDAVLAAAAQTTASAVEIPLQLY